MSGTSRSATVVGVVGAARSISTSPEKLTSVKIGTGKELRNLCPCHRFATAAAVTCCCRGSDGGGDVVGRGGEGEGGGGEGGKAGGEVKRVEDLQPAADVNIGCGNCITGEGCRRCGGGVGGGGGAGYSRGAMENVNKKTVVAVNSNCSSDKNTFVGNRYGFQVEGR